MPNIEINISGNPAAMSQAIKTVEIDLERLRNRVEAARQSFAQIDEIKAFGNSLKSLGVGTQGLTLAGKQFDELTTKAASLDSGLARISPTAANIASGIGSFAKTAGIALGGITAAGLLAQQGFEQVFGATMRLADAVNTLSQRSGIGTDAIQRLGYAASQSEGSMEAVGQGMRFLSQNMDQAARGSKEAQESFSRMGISIRDASGNLKTSEQVFYDVADAMQRTTDGGQRQAMAMQLLGRGGVELVPLLSQGSRAIREMGDEAQAMGAVMSGEAIQAMDDFDDALTAFTASGQQLKSAILGAILPAMTDWIRGFIDITSAGEKGEKAIAQFWKTLASRATFGLITDQLSETEAAIQGVADAAQTAREKAAALDTSEQGVIKRDLADFANRSKWTMEQSKKNLSELLSWAKKVAPEMTREVEKAIQGVEAEQQRAAEDANKAAAKRMGDNIKSFGSDFAGDFEMRMLYLGRLMAESQAKGFSDEAKRAKEEMKNAVAEQMQAIRDQWEGDGDLQRTVRVKHFEALLKLAQEHGVATREIEKAIAAERKAIRADDAREAQVQERAGGAGRVAEIQQAGRAMVAAERTAGQERAQAIREAAELAAEAKIGGEIGGAAKAAGAAADAGAGIGAGADAGGPMSDAVLERLKRAAEMEANRLRNAAKTDAERAAADAAAAKAAGLAKEVKARQDAGKQEGKVDADLAAARKKASEAQLEANRKLNEAKKTGREEDQKAAEAAIKAAKEAQKAADELGKANKAAGEEGKKAGEEMKEGMDEAKEGIEDAAGAASGKGGGGGGGKGDGAGSPPPLDEAIEDAEKAKEAFVEDVVEEVPKAKEKFKETGKTVDDLAESIGKAGKAAGGGGGGGGDQIGFLRAGGVSMGDGGTLQTPGGGGGGGTPQAPPDSGHYRVQPSSGKSQTGGGGGGGGGLTTRTPDGRLLRPRVVNGKTVWEEVEEDGVTPKRTTSVAPAATTPIQATLKIPAPGAGTQAGKQRTAATARSGPAAPAGAGLEIRIDDGAAFAKPIAAALQEMAEEQPLTSTRGKDVRVHPTLGTYEVGSSADPFREVRTVTIATEQATVSTEAAPTMDKKAQDAEIKRQAIADAEAKKQAAAEAAAERAKFEGQLATTSKAEELSGELAKGRKVSGTRATLDRLAAAVEKLAKAPAVNVERMTITPTVQTTQKVDGDAIGRQVGRSFVTEMRKPDRSPL